MAAHVHLPNESDAEETVLLPRATREETEVDPLIPDVAKVSRTDAWKSSDLQVADFRHCLPEDQEYVVALLPSAMYTRLRSSMLFPWYHPERLALQVLTLILMSLLGAAGYAAFDSIGVVQREIEEAFHISVEQFAFLYSIYSLPNIFLSPVGGNFLDRIGLRRGVVIAVLIAAVGHTAVCFAPYMGSAAYGVMLGGRMIYGIGAELGYVAVDLVITAWFRGKLLTFALSTENAAGSLGSFLMFSFSPMIVDTYDDYRASLWFGCLFVVVALLSGCLYAVVDKVAEVQLGRPINAPDVGPSASVGLREAITRLPLDFWLIVLLSMSYYIVLYPFQSNGPAFLEDRYGFDMEEAGRLTGFIALAILASSSVWGYVIDKVGGAVVFVFFGFALIGGGLLFILIGGQDPSIGLVLIGLGYPPLLALYACMAEIVDVAVLGTGYGVVYALCNAAQMAGYSIIGALHTETRELELKFYLGVVVFAMATALVLLARDYASGSRMNRAGPWLLRVFPSLRKAEPEQFVNIM